MKRVCIQCNKEFELTQSEINFYKSKKLHLPKRCKECRASNKAAKVTQTEQTIQQVGTSKKKSPVIYSLLSLLVLFGIFVWNQFPLSNDGNDMEATSYENSYEQEQSQQIEEPSAEIEEVETTVSRTSTRTFRKEEYLQEHYEKHGIDMGFDSAAEYLAAANKVLENEDVLHKIEAEDGDNAYYLEATNEFVIVSTDGYIRTYFYPEDGMDYFNRQ